MSEVFSGDISRKWIPKEGVNLAPGIMLVDRPIGRAIEFENRIDGSYITQEEPLYQSLRTLFLRAPNPNESKPKEGRS